jgi:hypothetical protein
MLEHPKVASRTCRDCQTYRYTADGDVEIGRNSLPVLRMPGDPTPCDTCPRKSPTREEETTLTERNWKAYAWYLEVRAMYGAGLVGAQRTDPLARRVLRTIDVIVRDYELSVQVNSMASMMAAVMGSRV